MKSCNNQNEKNNYCILIEENLGVGCAYIMNFFVLLWYSNLILIIFMNCKIKIYLGKNFVINTFNISEKYELLIYALIIILLVSINYKNNLSIIHIDLIYGFTNNFLTIIVN